MNKEREQKQNKKKKLIIVLIVLLCAVPVLFLLNRLLDRDWASILRQQDAVETRPLNIRFAEADYDEDIFEDAAYLDKNRDLIYTEGGVTRVISENHAYYGAGVEFFYRYFLALMCGDADMLNSLYREEYFADHDRFADFTMQKVYNIEIEKLSETLLEEGAYAGCKRYTFRVAYMILDNNGTFRRDVGSDAAVPEIFELLEDETSLKIYSVSGYIRVE